MKKNKKIKLYAVCGVNGMGICDDYSRVMESSRYLACFKCKKFDDFEKAKRAAEDMYWDLQGDNIFDYTIPEIRRINFIYYRKKCEAQNVDLQKRNVLEGYILKLY